MVHWEAEATMRATLTMLVVAGLIAGCAHRPDAAALQSVLQADRDFAARARVVGLGAAFAEYAASDAIVFRVGVGPIRGRAAIGESFAGFGNATLEWAPEAAEVAAAGDLAYTWGWYTVSAEGKSSTGNYVSIWRRVDGQWRYVIDLGAPAPRPR
jgi:ketosteroid isomerase-like protein